MIGSLFSGIGGPRRSGRGAQPKTYPSEMVLRVAELYSNGSTQSEVASTLGVSQKVVWNLMRRHQIDRRVAAKRNQRGANNHAWKAGAAKYAAMHLRVAQERGAPSLCEHCGTTESARFEWASLTKNYADMNDYVRLCCSCHHKMDGHVKNLGQHAIRKEVRP
jgi:hypothetical protein